MTARWSDPGRLPVPPTCYVNGNWDPSGAWDDRYPMTLVNSRTAGSGKRVVPGAVIAASIALDALLLRGDPGELKAAETAVKAAADRAAAAYGA